MNHSRGWHLVLTFLEDEIKIISMLFPLLYLLALNWVLKFNRTRKGRRKYFLINFVKCLSRFDCIKHQSKNKPVRTITLQCVCAHMFQKDDGRDCFSEPEAHSGKVLFCGKGGPKSFQIFFKLPIFVLKRTLVLFSHKIMRKGANHIWVMMRNQSKHIMLMKMP